MSAEQERADLKSQLDSVCQKIDGVKEDISDVKEDVSNVSEKVGDIRQQLPGEQDLVSDKQCDRRHTALRRWLIVGAGLVASGIGGAYAYTYSVQLTVRSMLERITAMGG